MEHSFKGQWITDSEFYDLEPRNVFHRQLDKVDLPCANHRNRHILFRKKFNLERCGDHAEIFISADDYYKLYINGIFAGQGPAPSYHFQYQYNCIDVSRFLKKGENIIAIHTLYQGLINRVWQSGDNRHGLILDLMIKNTVVVSSDESFTTRPHSGYSEMGTCGYETQFLERYDSGAAEIDFSQMDFDDSKWDHAKIRKIVDYTLTGQKSHMLDFETIAPIISKEALLNNGAWRRMLREDATTTFEGWGKSTKWNTSLFHLTMSYVATFMADVAIEKIL